MNNLGADHFRRFTTEIRADLKAIIMKMALKNNNKETVALPKLKGSYSITMVNLTTLSFKLLSSQLRNILTFLYLKHLSHLQTLIS